MKKLVFAVALLVPSLSHAAGLGLGASARSDEATVYLPIELNPVFRLEPFFSFGESESSIGATIIETEFRQLGVGGFARMERANRLQPYFGGRLSYVDSETTTDLGPPFGAVTSDEDGFRVEPAIGVEFFVIEQVAVGLEAFLYYQSLDGSTNGASSEDESMGNGTRLLLRILP
jgi:hypothetical protein